jgi:hypothetical protein
MSKRIQRYECDECGAVWPDSRQADSCASGDRERKDQEAQEATWRKFDDEYSWRLTVEQIEELTRLCESWHGHPVTR